MGLGDFFSHQNSENINQFRKDVCRLTQKVAHFMLHFLRLAQFKLCPRILTDFDLKHDFMWLTGIKSQRHSYRMIFKMSSGMFRIFITIFIKSSFSGLK